MTPFLESNLELAYPFVDGTVVPAIYAVADAAVISDQPGPYVVEVFDPQSPAVASGFKLRISGPNGVFLETTGCALTVLGDYTFVSMTDPVTSAMARFILRTSGLNALGTLPSPAELVASVCHEVNPGLKTLQALSGDVEISLPDYCTATQDGAGAVTLTFQDPADRVDCSGPSAENVFGFGGGRADSSGSLSIDAAGCYRLVPVLGTPGLLHLLNFCDPCVACADINTLQNKLTSQASYYHQLSAIYVDQFNRYQNSVAAVNTKIGAVETGADITVATGFIDFVGRVFNRPYFNQVFVAVVNNTLHTISVSLTLSITDPAVGSQLAVVPSSLLVTKTLSGGAPFADFAGFPGVVAFAMDPQDSVGFNSELQRMSVAAGAPTTAAWRLTATVEFTGGPLPLPATTTITKLLTPTIQLFGAPLTVVTS
jgi:hypothetical protein